jgi:hypothetical protein
MMLNISIKQITGTSAVFVDMKFLRIMQWLYTKTYAYYHVSSTGKDARLGRNFL